MSRSDGVKAIRCPGCGAGLDVLGGGRVTSHVCGYCGAELDAVENYRVLRKFDLIERPATPFRIGMTGRIAGIAHTVIGIMALRETDGGIWDWTDHLLYSPTHGYCWITLEAGHLILTRRFRGAVRPGWMGVDWVESAKKPPQVKSGGTWFRYYETSTSTIRFVEGEFTWRPAVGDRSTTVSALSEDAMLGFVESGAEREIEQSTWLPPAETLAAFGIGEPLRPQGVHPLQPFTPGPNARFFLRAGGLGAAVSALLAAYLLAQPGHQALATVRLTAAELPAELPVEIATPDRLAVITLHADVSNSWAFVEFDLTDPEDRPVFVGGREIGYYFGYDDGNWSEGSRQSQLKFRPEIAGTYTLGIEMSEAGYGETPQDGYAPELTVSARDGLASPFWSFAVALVLAAIALWPQAAAAQHRRRRWAGTDWDDDDDDD